MRLYRLPVVVAPLTAIADLLQWLDQQGYPAPAVLTTLDQQLVGVLDDWAALVLGYVDGAVLDADPPRLQQLATMLGRLHNLPVPATHPFAISRAIQMRSNRREARVSHPDFPFVLRKLQARAEAIDAIAALAVRVAVRLCDPDQLCRGDASTSFTTPANSSLPPSPTNSASSGTTPSTRQACW